MREGRPKAGPGRRTRRTLRVVVFRCARPTPRGGIGRLGPTVSCRCSSIARSPFVRTDVTSSTCRSVTRTGVRVARRSGPITCRAVRRVTGRLSPTGTASTSRGVPMTTAKRVKKEGGPIGGHTRRLSARRTAKTTSRTIVGRRASTPGTEARSLCAEAVSTTRDLGRSCPGETTGSPIPTSFAIASGRRSP
ncbi:hypothetical protein KPB2_5534 [Klebsiella pneumoniae Kb677]|nr:hypothetical protein KPB2_5534 [Klebsiella pneumoniae Kb677]